MNDTQATLDILYAQNKEEKKQMSVFKWSKWNIAMMGVVASASMFGEPVLEGAGFVKHFESVSSEEREVLSHMKEYCYNPVKRDDKTCLLWTNILVKHHDANFDPTSPTYTQQLATKAIESNVGESPLDELEESPAPIDDAAPIPDEDVGRANHRLVMQRVAQTPKPSWSQPRTYGKILKDVADTLNAPVPEAAL